jgi:thiol-disulfide isomerase/thioredoxin
MKSSLTGILFLCLLMFVATPFLSATEKAAEGLSWETDISVAMEKAKKEGKDILINFTGSDWCGWCKKLVDPKKNDKHRDEMGVNGYPTIMLADAMMRPYGRTGYLPGGPAAYLKNLDELRTDGEKLKKLLAAEDAEASKMLTDVFGVMTKNELLGYPGYSKYLEMAEKSDNEELKKQVAAHKAGMRLKELMNTREPDFPTLVAFLSENPDVTGPDALNALWFAHQWLAGEKRIEEAKGFLNRMLKDPLIAENPQGKQMIEQALHNLDHPDGNHDHDGDGVPDH